jgi:hypothetical protein
MMTTTTNMAAVDTVMSTQVVTLMGVDMVVEGMVVDTKSTGVHLAYELSPADDTWNSAIGLE